MKPDHLKKINSWFLGQIEALKAEGASEKDLNDPAVADLALRKIFEEHFDEMDNDSELTDDTFAIVSNQASPLELRELAIQAKQEKLGIGHYLELVANYRENQTAE